MPSRPAGSSARRPLAAERSEERPRARAGEAGFRTLAEDAPCAIFILQSAQVRFANAAARRIIGCSRGDLDRCCFWDVVHPDDKEKVRRLLAGGLQGSAALSRHEVKLVRRNGQPRWMDLSARVVSFRGRPAIMGVGFDITERKRADARIEALAYRDALTSLPNRRLLQDRVGVAMAHAQRRGERLGVLFLDLDHFKDVNDSLGHQAGDELLKAVAARLSAAMRRDDTVARIGGDEFVVLLAHIADAAQAEHVARKILTLLKAPVRLGDRELFVNGSIGISLYPDDGRNFDDLLRNADAALYRAKSQARADGDCERDPLPERPPAREGPFDPSHGVEGPGAGMQGALDVIGAASLLQICRIALLSGALVATHEARTIRMTFEMGRLAAATSGNAQGRDAVQEFLTWTRGRFAFHPGVAAVPIPSCERGGSSSCR